MPWLPAWIMATAAAACAYPAISSTPAAAPPEVYDAGGNQPFWSLDIHNGRIDYVYVRASGVSPYGERRISVDRPLPRRSFNGRRYVTPRLIVDIAYVRCIDATSGEGFEHQVTVTADGETVSGCGGARRPQWDR
jgi:heat shock protein HslJ